MAARAATWIAFGSIAKRTLTTATPTRYNSLNRTCQPISPYSKVSKRTKLPKNHFTSNHKLEDREKERDDGLIDKQPTATKRKGKAASNSLRRVALEAQRSHNLIKGYGRRAHVDPGIPTKEVTAYCAAETYNIHHARRLLEKEGHHPTDPLESGPFPQVLHVQTPDYIFRDPETGAESRPGTGDIFIFPSGSIVTWNVPEWQAQSLVHRVLPPAASGSHLSQIETEDLSYVENPSRQTSKIVGDTILLGASLSTPSSGEHPAVPSDTTEDTNSSSPLLAKLAFSSALARSAKLSSLETNLNAYFSTTRSIPQTLSSGRKLRFTRAFILRKTGELLHIRAQLNIYSELTDSLPDLFWDSPHELGLEGYYEQLGRALDVNVRIKVLNERMDYAREIAEVLRERLSEKHSTGLEWLIIGLISIEVGFGVLHLWKERAEKVDPDSTKALFTQWLERELRDKKA